MLCYSSFGTAEQSTSTIYIYSAYNNNNNGKMCVYTQFHLLLLLFVYICVSSLFQCTLSCSSLLSLALSDFIVMSMFCLYKLMFQPGYTMILYYIYDYICHYYYYYTTTICLVIANNVFIKLTISGILFSTYIHAHIERDANEVFSGMMASLYYTFSI